MCRTYVEDMIDFFVSDTYRDHYFELMKTPHHSLSYRGCRDRLADRLDAIDRKLLRLSQPKDDSYKATNRG